MSNVQTIEEGGATQLKSLLPVITAGLVVGIISVVAEVSLAALIFSGDLSIFISRGIGLLLGGSIVALIITGFTSGLPGMVTVNQDIPASIMAVVAVVLADSVAATSTPEETLAVIIAFIVLTSVLTGVAYILQGYFKLGAFFRFLPYPVIGGFLAGSGWLLTAGGISVMADVSIQPATLLQLATPDTLVRWLPGLLFALTLWIVLNRFQHYAVLPSMLIASVVLYFGVSQLLGFSVDQLLAQGWLLGPLPDGRVWLPLPVRSLLAVDWQLVFAQVGSLLAITVVTTIALLLNTNGIELSTESELDLDRELQVAGLSTLGSAMVGGLVSYPGLGLSILGFQLAGRNRLLVAVVGLVLAFPLLAGPALLGLIPKMLVGGMLIFLGIDLLDQWLVKAWSRFSRLEYAIIVAILVVIVTVGFLQGVLLGVVLALVLFVVNYSKVDVVKHVFSAETHKSRVTRPRAQQTVLRELGETVHIMQLHGYIFFGTANNLVDRVGRRIEQADATPIRFLVLDFRQVTGLDSTATYSFTKLRRLAQREGVTLVFTNPEGQVAGQSETVGRFFAQLSAENDANVHRFSSLDRGVEWCENELLRVSGMSEQLSTTFASQLASLLPGSADVDSLINHFERLDVDSGYYLIKQGDPPDALFFVESGQVTAQLEYADRDPLRLETMGGGHVVGEIGFYLNKPRTAAVVADQPSVIYRLSTTTLTKMEQHDPEAASALHQSIMRLVGERMTHLIGTVNALQR